MENVPTPTDSRVFGATFEVQYKTRSNITGQSLKLHETALRLDKHAHLNET